MAGVGALAMRSIIRGAGSLDGAALAFAAEGLGGTLSSSAGIDWSGLSLPVLSENLAAAAEPAAARGVRAGLPRARTC